MPKINFRNSCFRQCLQIVVAFYLLVLFLQLYLVNSSKHRACTFVFVDWNLLNQNEKKLNIKRRLEPELLNLFLVYSQSHSRSFTSSFFSIIHYYLKISIVTLTSFSIFYVIDIILVLFNLSCTLAYILTN